MSDRLSAYLDVMGVEQWVLRGAEVLEDTAAVEVKPAAVLATASLAGFPANTQGQYLIVCAPAATTEGQGSAFEGAPADLLNAMLQATQWPADQCVLLADAEQLPLAIELVKPRVMVALGEAASQAALQGSVQDKRQQIHMLGTAKAVASYHPVLAQQDPKQFKRPIWEDLKLAMAEAPK